MQLLIETQNGDRAFPIVTLILTRLDYGNATIAGRAHQSLIKLQSVLNVAAHLIFTSHKFTSYIVCTFLRDRRV